MRIFPALLRIPKLGDWTIKQSNLPERYIRRRFEKIKWNPPSAHPRFKQEVVKEESYNFTAEHRPWQEEFRMEQTPDATRVTPILPPIRKWHFFPGDHVEILEGPDAGKEGRIKKVISERGWVIVDGLHCKYVTLGKTADYPGTLTKTEMPLSVHGEVALLDPEDNKPTKIVWRYDQAGNDVRVSTRTGRVIEVPIEAEETPDYKTKSMYKDNEDKDTSKDDLEKVTFEPVLKTFEMDRADKMGIKEEGVPPKTYWY